MPLLLKLKKKVKNMKKFIVLVSVVAVAFGAFCIDYTPVSEEAAATISGTQTFSGANTFSGNVTTSALVSETPTSTSLTNGATLTPTASVHILNGIGGANDTTNTVTVANPTASGQKLTLIVNSASTNLITIADSGNVSLSGAWLGDNNDSITLQAVSTSAWVETSSIDN